jgi:hypothetical protein
MALKLIGAGLGRTGTLSLKLALEQIGFGPCYHMVDVLMQASRCQSWVQAAAGDANWDAIFEGYTATVDYPGCTFWRELTEHYPSAKVLLTVRDPEEWFESTQKTIFSRENARRVTQPPLSEFFARIVFRDFGDRVHDREFMIAAFRRHNEEVQKSVPPDRLLVYQVADGWAPLCRFLGVAIPDRPFPRVNTREEFGARQAARGHAEGGQALDPETMARMVRENLERLRQKQDEIG